MTTPTPEEARDALGRLAVYANNGWGSACPGEVDALRRFIDAHSAPEPVARSCACANPWAHDQCTEAPGCKVLRKIASPPPAQPAQSLLRKPVSSIMEISATIPGGCYCPPDKCGAPVIMGRQTPCLRRDNTAAQPPQAEPVETVPWPTVTCYSGGASHEGIGGSVWIQLDDNGAEVEYVPAQPKREPLPLTDDVLDTASNALERAWQLGQTYWAQADSERYSENKKSDATHRKFMALIDETRRAIERLVREDQS